MHHVTLEDFSGVDFGDIRRGKRFVTLINNISSQPGSSIPRQNGNWYDVKATYEFFKNDEVSLEALKKVVSAYGSKQVEDQLQLLVVHDISTISFNSLQAEGLGYLANKEGRGILCYSSMAVSTAGLPLSLLYQHTWTRPLEELGKAARRKERNFGDKESYQWYAGITQVNSLLGNPIHKIHIADREADIYELFFSAYEPNTDVLVRAKHNRRTAEGGPVWDLVSSHPSVATVTLEIPDPSGKKKQSIEAEVRYQPVKILRPLNSKDKYESVMLTAIEIKEQPGKERKGEETIHWKLLTTLDIQSVPEALKCVRWYTYRWLIERFHYVLKSGTKIEELQLKQAESLQKAIVVYSIAAFRIMQLVYKARHYPQVTCETVLTTIQWKVLYLLIHKKKEIPLQVPTLHQAVMWIGKLGGHLGRKSDGPPGLKTVWLGYQHLCHATTVYEIAA
jgi:Transposase DNA-binding/Transposase Tn5 dimerisation domain